jgi:hypothetical protein
MDLNVRAEALVADSKINAVSMLTELRLEPSVLDNVNSDHWDLMVTIAGVYAAIAGVRSKHSKVPTKELLTAIFETINVKLRELDPNAENIYRSLHFMLEETQKSRTASENDSDDHYYKSDLGYWIVEQVFGHRPQSEQRRALASRVGGMVMDAMYGHFF